MSEFQTKNFHILCLDGGGSLGVYSLGILEEIAKLVGEPLCEKFDLIYGTSTGSIIGSLIAMGKTIKEISDLYDLYIPKIMSCRNSAGRTKALRECAETIFKQQMFDETSFKTLFCAVATRTDYNRALVFKSSAKLSRGKANFTPGFGCKISDAIIASCSAYPLFDPHQIEGNKWINGELFDGGFIANNPTLYAIIDAVEALKKQEHEIKVLNVGVGYYPSKSTGLSENFVRSLYFTKSFLGIFEATIATTNNATEELRKIIYPNVTTYRASGSYTDSKHKTNLLESDRDKLNTIKGLGTEFFRKNQAEIKKILDID
jgi:uncharacterized protein